MSLHNPKMPSLRSLLVVPLMGASLAVGLVACGGGGGDDDEDRPVAYNVIGQENYSTSAANSGGISAATLSQPLGSPSVSGDVVFVADTANNRVLGYTPIPDSPGTEATIVLGQTDATSNLPATTQTGLALPGSASVSEGRLVVADSGNNRVLIWNSIPTLSSTPPDVVLGQNSFTTATSGIAANKLSFPTAAIISSNRLIVADQSNSRVLIWDSIPTENGTAADVVLGQPDFVTRETGDDADEMSRPSSLWSDGFRLLVSDTGNNRVLFWQQLPDESTLEAELVIGQTDFGRSSSGSGTTGMNTPYGVGSDGSRIYVADSGNNRVLEFSSFPLADGMAAADVYGQEDFSDLIANDDDQDGESDDTPSDRTLSGPTGVTVADGIVYISDRNNNRVLQFPQ